MRSPRPARLEQPEKSAATGARIDPSLVRGRHIRGTGSHRKGRAFPPATDNATGRFPSPLASWPNACCARQARVQQCARPSKSQAGRRTSLSLYEQHFRAEARPQGSDKTIFGWKNLSVSQKLMQDKQDGGRRHVPVAPQDFPRMVHLSVGKRERLFVGLDDLRAAWMRHDVPYGAQWYALLLEERIQVGKQALAHDRRDIAGEEHLQPAVVDHPAHHVPRVVPECAL